VAARILILLPPLRSAGSRIELVDDFAQPVAQGISPRKLPDPIEDSSSKPPLKPRPSAIFHIASTTGFEM
jgi:hypothetical protein